MGLFDKEEVLAPAEAVVAEAVRTPATVASKVECTRDTRGDADCAVKDCENCN
jgi:hypothetical protein